MPTYLLTIHTYRSWREDHPNGYVQRNAGLRPPNPQLAAWRSEAARTAPVRFSDTEQHDAHELIRVIAEECDIRLFACATTPTHVHILLGFESPACTCGASRVFGAINTYEASHRRIASQLPHCSNACDAQQHTRTFSTRLKRKLGQRLAASRDRRGPFLSRGANISRIRDREHFHYVITQYLPDHEQQGGIFVQYRPAE